MAEGIVEGVGPVCQIEGSEWILLYIKNKHARQSGRYDKVSGKTERSFQRIWRAIYNGAYDRSTESS